MPSFQLRVRASPRGGGGRYRRYDPEEPIEIGDRVTFGGREGIARSVEPILGVRELRLVVQLVRDS